MAIKQMVGPASTAKADDMSQTVRELLTELAWIEDSIRHVPLTVEPVGAAANARQYSEVNADLVALAEREREIIAELRRYTAAPT